MLLLLKCFECGFVGEIEEFKGVNEERRDLVEIFGEEDEGGEEERLSCPECGESREIGSFSGSGIARIKI